MRDDESESNPVVVALREGFRPILTIAESLPPPLRYSILAVFLILIIVLLGITIDPLLVVVIGILLVLGLAAYVYIDIDSRRVEKAKLAERARVEREKREQEGIALQKKVEQEEQLKRDQEAARMKVEQETLRQLMPEPGKLGILVDLSHGQTDWRPDSIFDLSTRRGNLISLIVPPSDHLVWDVHGTTEKSIYQPNILPNWRGLIFGLPYHEVIDQTALEAISQWVVQGGRLVILGYELGERHHRTNVNLLSDRFFGLRFNSDIVAPEGWATPHTKPYGEDIVFRDVSSQSHPILKGVRSLCMRNMCSLTIEPGSHTILPLGKQRTSSEIKPQYTNGWTSSGTQQFELTPESGWLPVIAEAPPSLCGKGRVIAIGTWYFFGTEECFRTSDNCTFVKNILEWTVDRT